LKRCDFSDYRFSEDLDFTLRQPLAFEDIRAGLERIYAAVQQASGITFTFAPEDRQPHVNSHTSYLHYTGALPAGNDVKVDITIDERLIFPLRERPILRGYDEFTDLPEGRVIHVYSLEEIVAQKTMALADAARNEPRDLYDLWYLTRNEGVELEPLIPAISRKTGVPRQTLRTTASSNCGKGKPPGRVVGQEIDLPNGCSAPV
jgi:predicted nucleotidyltransferase component of viral defense system